MSGIAGIFSIDGAPVLPSVLEFMSRHQTHRGPHTAGLFYEGGVGFVQRYLDGEDGPTSDGRPLTLDGHTIVFSGRLYNSAELRRELESGGYSFRGERQTEVVLASFMKWGESCVEHFNGNFAFAVWKASDKKLFCARDRLGIKPFFFFHDATRFEFASEIKALLHDPARRRPRLRTLVRFLSEGLTDDEAETFYRDIEILPAGHTMVVTRRGVTKKRYWRVDPKADWEAYRLADGSAPKKVPERTLPDGSFPDTAGLDEAAEAFGELFADSVRLRFGSGERVGVCLSGGLDSSSVVACASHFCENPVETFSSVYADRGYAEGSYISDVAQAFATRSHYIEADGSDLPELFDQLVWAQDEPSAGPGLYSQWKVMQRASQSVGVVLDGQGGDELLAGYHHYFREYLSELANELVANGESTEAMERVGEVIREVTGVDHTKLVERAIRRAKRPAILKLFQRERPGRVKTPPLLRRELASRVSRREARRTAVERIFDNSLSQKLYDDLTRFSIPPLLRYEDRNSMAFSLEARIPFLDHRLVEFCFALPNLYKIDPPHTKLILRKAMNGSLPASVTSRQDKLGYPTPLAIWFRGRLKPWMEDLLDSKAFQDCELLDTAACRAVFQDHLNGNDRSWDLWRVLHLFRWNELFIEGKGF